MLVDPYTCSNVYLLEMEMFRRQRELEELIGQRQGGGRSCRKQRSMMKVRLQARTSNS
ncbi:MAG TPA: hypothetical protein GX513_13305 [Firmicutes bacterium]|nr:hypothetical protein [Bacillota bacterium]